MMKMRSPLLGQAFIRRAVVHPSSIRHHGLQSRRFLSAGPAELRLHEALCDRHDPSAVALRYQLQSGADTGTSTPQELTFQALSVRSSRLAQALHAEADVRAGDVVAVMLPKGPQVMELAVALSRVGAIYQPLFTAFQPQGIRDRIGESQPKAIVTDALNLAKFGETHCSGQVTVCVASEEETNQGDLDYEDCATNGVELSLGDHDQAPSLESDGDHPLSLLFSSGTTGPPKGILCPVKALENFQIYLQQGIGVTPSSNYWNMADSGWAYGLYYNVYAPLLLGQTAHMLAGPFSPEGTVQFLADHQITHLAGAPTVYRALRQLTTLPNNTSSPMIAIQSACSAGEPLPPSVSQWFQTQFGVPIANHYGQTENGMMINQHYHDNEHLEPSTMGTPMQGFEGACLLDENGQVITQVGAEGEICMKVADCPLFWFDGYYKKDDRPVMDEQGYYHTGDRARLAQTAASGETTTTFVYSSRKDDLINTAGYRVGPTEIETSIMQIPGVSEVAVLGVPDPLKGQAIVAFVVQAADAQAQPPSESSSIIVQHVKENLAKHLAPQQVHFLPSLPRTESGKVKRFLLREQWESTQNDPTKSVQ